MGYMCIFLKHNYINKCKWNIIERNGDFQIFLRYFSVISGDLWKTSWNFVVIDGDTRWQDRWNPLWKCLGKAHYRMGPPVELAFSWFISGLTLVYGRYKELVFMGIISCFVNQLVTGGPHPVCHFFWRENSY